MKCLSWLPNSHLNHLEPVIFVFFSLCVFFLRIRRPPRSTLDRSSAASDVYKRQERIDAIHAVLDGEYETQAEVAAPAARAEGEVRGTWIRNPSISGGFGFSYRIGTNMEIGLEHRASHYFDDLADGQRWELDGDYTDHFDMFQYTNLTFGINLGKSESVDPLWELNPLTYLYDKVASIDPENLLKDSDNDGVIDYLDKEPNTAEGVPVDTHGVSLDSDKDGCPDSEDPEPFSSPVLPMENCQNVHVTMNEVKAYVDKALEGVSRDGGGAADWILPYIFFDLNKYDIRPDAVPTLNQVAEIMNRYKKLEVNVVGHTDTQGSESMNMKSVSYTHLRAYETVLDLVCRLLLEKKKHTRL